MPNRRLNKTIAGYHLLMILSAVDFRVSAEEDAVIRQYLVTEFPFHVSLDKEMEVISNLRPDEWEAHFRKVMDDFFDDATDPERKKLLHFALELTKADNVITKEENYYLNMLFENWEHDQLGFES
ncbi:MAG: TerB family tellurite resistance protein [Sphingobacteriales bacterium]|nr:MAG: TerB family tellurite resistance protein [Sphingobacteriales bacterium]